MNSARFLMCSKYIWLCLCVALFSFDLYAGAVGDIFDFGVKIALINIWKGLGGLALFIAGAYMIANRRPSRYKIMAVASSFTLVCMTIAGALLLIIEFWPLISDAVKATVVFIKHLFA